jgi:uncharacterized protein YraI
MKLPGFLIAALLLTAPTAAMAARGIATDSVNLRAGPGTGFPVVDRIPAGAHVNIHGCLTGDAWCDVSWSGDRGWVSSEYLQYYYQNRYVYLPDYFDVIDVPVAPFVLGTYWANYYTGRPFYHRRTHWTNYWRSHARIAERPRHDHGRASAHARGGEQRIGHERGERRAIREQMGRERTERGRTAHMNERRMNERRGNAGKHHQFAGPHGTTRFSGAPNNRRGERSHFGRTAGAPPQAHARGGEPRAIGRPMAHGGRGGGVGTVGRAGGAPFHARAQMGAPRAPAPHAMGGAPRAMGGGAPHMAAPGGGGMAGHRGGGHGRH